MHSMERFARKFAFTVYSLMLSALAAAAGAGTFDTLQWRNPYPTGNPYVSAAFGAGQFVVVDSAGDVLTTTDGHVWAHRGPSTSRNPQLLRHLGGRFVLIGSDGSIATSSDAITWTAQSSGTTQALHSVAYGNGVYAVGGAGATLLTSPDGVTWTPRIPGLDPATTSFQFVAFGSGRFVAAGGNSVYVSEDGANWTGYPKPGNQLTSLVATDAGFVADSWVRIGGNTSYPQPFTSTNGIDWIRNGNIILSDRAYVNNSHFATYLQGGAQRLSWSTRGLDTVDWIPTDLPSSFLIRSAGITYGNNTYFAVGQIGDFGSGRGAVAFSSNGTNWSVITNAGSQTLNISSGTFGAGKYLFQGNGVLYSSTDGVTFQTIADSQSLYGGAPSFLGGSFVRLGAGVISRSVDGLNWTRSRSGTLKTLRGITHGAGKWVAVGDGGEVRVSTDLQLWEGRWSGTDYPLHSVVYAQGKFVAVGHLGIIYSSADGLTWVQQNNADLGMLTRVIYGNGRFLAHGESLLTSPDGATWTRHALPAGYSKISFGGGQFVASGSTARSVLTSEDGVNWTVNNTPVGGSVDFLNETFFLFGPNGAVLQTTPVGAVVLSAAANPATGTFEVTVTGGQIGASYKLQSCADLAADVWSDVTTFVQNNAITVVPVPGGLGNPQHYYRALRIQ